MASQHLTVSIDTGGTFTDFVAERPSGEILRFKLPSTPDDPSRAIVEGLGRLRRDIPGPMRILHGTTVATNALLERKGARVALIATQGFEDLLWLRRQNRPQLYALHPELPEPLVEEGMAFGIRGRIDADGQAIETLENVDAFIDRHAAQLASAEALAICLLHSYINPRHEQAVAASLRRRFPGVPVSVSSELAPVFREYERSSTVAVNAFVSEVMARYLRRLAEAVAPDEVEIMGSSGGLLSAERATHAPVHTVLSGPAGGVRGAWRIGRRAGAERLLALDMGGTSADVSLILGDVVAEDEGSLDGLPLRVPLLPVETVGAGGGSIAWIDQGGALRVGPKSAGARPGPACYGHGGSEPTVTDAHVVLGRLPDLLGGSFKLDREAACRAVSGLATRLGTSLETTAKAILATAEATMARACKRVSLERGVDPRGLSLLAFGGAGGLHACALAEELGCTEVIFPEEPGVLSAEGILFSPREASATQSLFLEDSAWTAAGMAETLSELAREASRGLNLAKKHDSKKQGLEPNISIQGLADLRYRGQSYTLALPFHSDPVALKAAFENCHAERYGYRLERPVEWVALRVFARSDERRVVEPAAPGKAHEEPKIVEVRQGPVSISTYSATLWLPELWRAERLTSGDWRCRRERSPRGECAEERDSLPEILGLEIHRQRIAAIAEEMGATLMRAACSANIKERRDFSCAVFDREGRMLVHAAHIPVHLGSTPMSVRAAIEAVPMRPGQTVILNDPFAGGTHLPDVTLVSPVFDDDGKSLLFYIANRAHHADIGGAAPGSLPVVGEESGGSLTIDDEGFRMPPMPLDDAVREAFARASRTPDDRYGDLRAQEAANFAGSKRMLQLAHEIGLERLDRLNGRLLDYAERRMRGILAALPDGDYRFVDWLDDDGAGGPEIPIPVVIRIAGDTAEVDLREAPPAVPSSLNAVRAIAVSAVFYAFRCLGESGIPANDGILRPIRILTRPGSIVDALPPRAVSAGNVETSQRIVDAIFGALAQANPDVPAASAGSMNNVLFGGKRPGSGQIFVHYETLAGGAGASRRGPGASAIHTHMTNTLNTPIEALERDFPVRIDTYGLRRRSPGALAGGFPGGAGILRQYRFLVPATVTVVSERRKRPPYGLGGGASGEMGRNTLISPTGEESPLGGKAVVEIPAGGALRVETPGGGGFAPLPLNGGGGKISRRYCTATGTHGTAG